MEGSKWFRRIVFLVGAIVLLNLLLMGWNTQTAVAEPPSWAAQPIQSRWITVDVFQGWGLNLGCVNLEDNPFGYYRKYTRYAGWWYIDANGVTYYGWFNDHERGAVMGPYDVVWSQRWFRCGF